MLTCARCFFILGADSDKRQTANERITSSQQKDIYDCSILHPDCQELQSRIYTSLNKFIYVCITWIRLYRTGMSMYVGHYIIVYSTASWELPQSVSNVLGPWILRVGCAVTCRTAFQRGLDLSGGSLLMLTIHFKHLQNHLHLKWLKYHVCLLWIIISHHITYIHTYITYPSSNVFETNICHLLQSVFSLCVTWCIWAIRCRPKLSKLPLRCDACDVCAACAAEICGCDCF